MKSKLSLILIFAALAIPATSLAASFTSSPNTVDLTSDFAASSPPLSVYGDGTVYFYNQDTSTDIGNASITIDGSGNPSPTTFDVDTYMPGSYGNTIDWAYCAGVLSDFNTCQTGGAPNGSFALPTEGCNDSAANNFDPSAGFNDGSCTYDSGTTTPTSTPPVLGYNGPTEEDFYIVSGIFLFISSLGLWSFFFRPLNALEKYYGN